AVTKTGEVAIAHDHVRGRVEGGCAGEEVRVMRDEEERLLSAHAAPEGEDPTPVDVKPRKGALDEVGHVRQIGDLARISPRVELQAASLPLGVHDRERPDGGEVAPDPRVHAGVDAAAVG